jgi:uncharacterized lipoprotein YajG
MKTLKNITLVLAAALTLASCSKDDNNLPIDNPKPLPTAASFAALKEKSLENLKQKFTLTAEDGVTTLTSAKGVKLTIDGSCLRKNGNAVTGAVNVEITEIFDAGSMLATDVTSTGVMADGNQSVLISAGEFLVTASQGGVQLTTTCGMPIAIPGSLTGGFQAGMELWDLKKQVTGKNAWEKAGRQVDGKGGVYYTALQGFGYTNVDRFGSDPRPKTTLLATVPAGYNFDNCGIYIHYDNLGSNLANFDKFLSATNQFTEHYGQIPIGLQAHVIFVTEDQGQFRYAIKAVTVAANDIYNFTLAETVLGTETQMKAAINALP